MTSTMDVNMIGRQAYCKETGPNHCGIIVGMITGGGYRAAIGNKADFSIWNKKFPGWDADTVYYVHLSQPQKSCTFHEYTEVVLQHPAYQRLTPTQLRLCYDKEVPEVQVVGCPIEGLEIL